MANKQPTFRELSDQLDEVLAKLQREDIDVDEALKLHQQGSKLIEQLEERLGAAEVEVKHLKDSAPKRG